MWSFTGITVLLLMVCSVNAQFASAEDLTDRNAIKARLQEFRDRQIRADNEKRLKSIEAHKRVWHRYGDIEIKRSGWMRQPDQVWMTQYQVLNAQNGEHGQKDNAINLFQLNPSNLQRPDPSVLRHEPPRSFDASLDDLVREGVVTLKERERFLGNNGKISWIAISCRSLMISRLGVVMNSWFTDKARKYWEKWFRPEAGTYLEDLIADRCSSDAITVPSFEFSTQQ
jgi:hypothetical protein